MKKVGLGLKTYMKYLIVRMITPNNICFKRPVEFNRQMKFCGKGKIIIGERTRNRGNVLLESVCDESLIKIGSNTFFNNNNMIICRKQIIIGDNCMFGPNICIYDHDHYYSQKQVYPYKFIDTKIQIGNNVWCGANVIILRGTIIGDGSVIGAGTVVKGIVPPHTVIYSTHNYETYQITDN